MKITSYEISKKLAKAGFKSSHEFFWGRTSKDYPLMPYHVYLKHSFATRIPAYDLETVLEYLPGCIEVDKELYDLEIDDIGLSYLSRKNSHFFAFKADRTVCTNPRRVSETLADTAARLLLILHEKGIIKFNEVKP
jgi:hypothetical protein